MGMETLGNTGIVAGGMGAGVQPMIDLMGGRHDYNDGGFGGNGMWAILLLALLGRRGFGDDGGSGFQTGAEIHNSDRFNQLSDQINANTNFLAQNNNFQTLLASQHAADVANCAQFAEVQKGFGSIALESCKGFGITNANIAENKFAAALGFANQSKELADCCCTIRMEGMQNTQKILDALCEDKVERLQSKVNELSLGLSQCQQNEKLINAIRPTAVPAWQSCSPYVPTPWNVGGTGCC